MDVRVWWLKIFPEDWIRPWGKFARKTGTIIDFFGCLHIFLVRRFPQRGDDVVVAQRPKESGEHRRVRPPLYSFSVSLFHSLSPSRDSSLLLSSTAAWSCPAWKRRNFPVHAAKSHNAIMCRLYATIIARPDSLSRSLFSAASKERERKTFRAWESSPCMDRAESYALARGVLVQKSRRFTIHS